MNRKRATFTFISLFIFVTLYFFSYQDKIGLFFSNPNKMPFIELLEISIVFLCLSGIIKSLFNMVFGEFDTDIDEFFKEKVKNGTILPVFLLITIIGPLIEEILFRVLPFLIIGFFNLGDSSTSKIAFGFTAIWVLLHGKRAVFLIPSGVFYYILLINGLIIPAFLLHVLNNTYAASFKFYSLRENILSSSEYSDEGSL